MPYGRTVHVLIQLKSNTSKFGLLVVPLGYSNLLMESMSFFNSGRHGQQRRTDQSPHLSFRDQPCSPWRRHFHFFSTNGAGLYLAMLLTKRWSMRHYLVNSFSAAVCSDVPQVSSSARLTRSASSKSPLCQASNLPEPRMPRWSVGVCAMNQL